MKTNLFNQEDKRQEKPSQVIYVAAFASSDDGKWFSPGRARKIDQVLSHLSSLGLSLSGLNIASTIPQNHDIPITNMCSSRVMPIRYIQLIVSSIIFICSLTSRSTPRYLWLYNTRSAEGLVALILLFFVPSLSLVIQLEDLAMARKANSGLSGLLDLASTHLLQLKASHVFAVSPQVASSFSLLTGRSVANIAVLPPALHPFLVNMAQNRRDPFQQDQISILYAGGYSIDKGVDILLDAFQSIHSQQFQLILVGSCPTSLHSVYSSNKRISFAGVLTNLDLFNLYTSVDIIVNPHRPVLNPGFIFPFKLLEVLASGALPLTTPVPGYEDFEIPRECVFTNSSQLASCILASRSLWSKNSRKIKAISSRCQLRYCFDNVAAVISSELKLVK
jgi:glycosyltransferase involved in cell wall biosynthesis